MPIRNWMFLLLYFKNDKRSPKYALEGLYVMFQVHSLLSPKASRELVWNRFAKRSTNRMFKDAVKLLGPNASRKSFDRICHAMGVTKQLTDCRPL